MSSCDAHESSCNVRIARPPPLGCPAAVGRHTHPCARFDHDNPLNRLRLCVRVFHLIDQDGPCRRDTCLTLAKVARFSN